MHSRNPLLIVGASTRAAAFAALRAHLQPWCADRFGDADLQARCAITALAAGRYPHGLVAVARQGPPGPWMYTGGLENRPALIWELSLRRPLWGNDPSVLAVVRSPGVVRELLRDAGLCCPALRGQAPDRTGTARWLVKPLAGAGGAGIAFWNGTGTPRLRRRVYFQEYVEGTPFAAAYVGDGRQARLLGVTRQLVGEPWLNAAPFHYGGSIGPVPIPAALRRALECLGDVLVKGSGLRGLFGVDFILRDGEPWPVEVNPRYTASLEVLEYASGLPVLALHRRVFEPDAPPVVPVTASSAPGWIGKAILFARTAAVFPTEGPWQAALRHSPPLDALPAFADIPPAGQTLPAGGPVLTFFARGSSLADCEDTLRQTAVDLDRWLFGR